MNAKPLYGLVLAGGRSLRMGIDKAALRYHDHGQAQHMAALLGPYCESVFVSIRTEQACAPYLEGLQTISDYYASPTPLNGILSAMRAKPEASWLVAAVDMPNITPASIETLIARRNPLAVATCFESPAKGGPDPLFAIWEGHAFAALENLLRDCNTHICPRSVLKTLPHELLVNAVTPEILDNANTPEEFERLREKVS